VLSSDEKIQSDPKGNLRVESHEIRGGRLLKRVLRQDGKRLATDFGTAPKRGTTPAELHALADQRYLQTQDLPEAPTGRASVAIADLFSGLGALTLGAMEAARVVGVHGKLVLAADNEPAPLEVLRKTLAVGELEAREIDLATALRPTSGKRTKAETDLIGRYPEDLDILVAGPPVKAIHV